MKTNVTDIITSNNYVVLDINKCATEEPNCSPVAVWNNTKGSHNCECKPEYSGDGWYWWLYKDLHSCGADADSRNFWESNVEMDKYI